MGDDVQYPGNLGPWVDPWGGSKSGSQGPLSGIKVDTGLIMNRLDFRV